MLRKVVEGHVRLGQPVGSKWLSEQPDMEWASSTMRAELARLEELELLRHPHTSAGRVPTDIGYRYCRRPARPPPAARGRPPLRPR